jgi:CheY-like chemotaxis protein
LSEPAKVLVAEDNKINQYLVTHILQRCGYTYRLAANGLEAVEAFQEMRPDLVLMDIQMPVMDGLEATQRIRRLEDQSEPRTPIVALTARAQPQDRELCLEAGMDDYLSKPVRMETLTERLTHWLREKAA